MQPKGLRVQHPNIGWFQMSLLVQDHVSLLHKALLADVAGEWPLSGVDSLMQRQLEPLEECLGTVRALEASVALVRLDVSCQRLLVGEGCTALFARKGSICAMAA